MATVIDKLLVQIGLDSKGLNKGMDATLKKLKESEKQTGKIAKNNRKNYKQAIEDSEEHTDALDKENKQYAVLGSTLKGMAKGFVAIAASRKVLSEISDLSNVERVSKFLGMTTTQVGTLQKMSENVGDSSQSVLNSVADIYDKITGLEVEGKSSQLFAYFNRIGVSVTDQNGKLKDTRTLLTDIRKGLMGIDDERKRAYMARQMGLGEGLTYLFSKDDTEFNKAIDAAEEQAKSIDKASKAAQSATESVKSAINAAKGAAMDIYSGKGDEVLGKAKGLGGQALDKTKEVGGNIIESAKKGLRNFRNNNAGNIRYSPWSVAHGAIGKDDKGFAIFPSKEVGSRAQDELLQNYISRGKNTLRSIIEKYAPPSENDTKGYYQQLGKKLHIGVDEPINPKDTGFMTRLSKEIARIEGDPRAYVESLSANQPLFQPSRQSISNNNGITINGDITVNTQATDAKGIVRDLSTQIGRKSALSEGNMH